MPHKAEELYACYGDSGSAAAHPSAQGHRQASPPRLQRDATAHTRSTLRSSAWTQCRHYKGLEPWTPPPVEIRPPLRVYRHPSPPDNHPSAS